MRPAEITIECDGAVRSLEFDDVYASRQGGLAEAEHVFLTGNGLPQRWRGQTVFTVAELGFGTGLNFLATWLAWRRGGPDRPGRLHFVSVEQYPLRPADLQRVYEHHTTLHPMAAELLRQYPPLLPGVHRRVFDDEQVVLTLAFGDASALLPQMTFAADAWYLDGFAPAKNPQLWSVDVLQQVAQHCTKGSTAATYSVAGSVRRNLAAVGFTVERQRGFGSKREMLAARLEDPSVLTSASDDQPWFRRSDDDPLPRSAAIAVIGGGLAGTSAARSCAERGFAVTVYDGGGAGGEASAVPAAVFKPHLSIDAQSQNSLYLNGLALLLQRLDLLEQHEEHPLHERCHVAWAAADEQTHARQEALLERFSACPQLLQQADVAAMRSLTGLAMQHGGVIMQTAGWLDAPAFCRRQLHHPRITFAHANVAAMNYEREKWAIRTTDDAIHHADAVIIAAGHAANDVLGSNLAALQPVRGQITFVDRSALPHVPRCIVRSGKCDVVPAKNRVTVGSIFERDNMSREVTSNDHQRNLQALRSAIPDAPQVSLDAVRGGWAGVRSCSPDRLPLIGPVPDVERYAASYCDIHHGKPVSEYPPPTYCPRLFISTAHGARGTVTAVIAGEMIAAMLTGEPLPIDEPTLHRVHPGRFLIRDFKRRATADVDADP